jgi:DNA-binding transcriptional MerR regulator
LLQNCGYHLRYTILALGLGFSDDTILEELKKAGVDITKIKQSLKKCSFTFSKDNFPQENDENFCELFLRNDFQAIEDSEFELIKKISKFMRKIFLNESL